MQAPTKKALEVFDSLNFPSSYDWNGIKDYSLNRGRLTEKLSDLRKSSESDLFSFCSQCRNYAEQVRLNWKSDTDQKPPSWLITLKNMPQYDERRIIEEKCRLGENRHKKNLFIAVSSLLGGFIGGAMAGGELSDLITNNEQIESLAAAAGSVIGTTSGMYVFLLASDVLNPESRIEIKTRSLEDNQKRDFYRELDEYSEILNSKGYEHFIGLR